jgi:hypothetical protein
MPAKKNLFLQKVAAEIEEKGTEGKLHRVLKVPLDYNMGDMMTFLEKIDGAIVGHTIKNPLAHGIREILITPKLQRQVRFAIRGIKASRGEYKPKKKTSSKRK